MSYVSLSKSIDNSAQMNVRFWHKADVQRRALVLSISSVFRYTVIALIFYIQEEK